MCVWECVHVRMCVHLCWEGAPASMEVTALWSVQPFCQLEKELCEEDRDHLPPAGLWEATTCWIQVRLYLASEGCFLGLNGIRNFVEIWPLV